MDIDSTLFRENVKISGHQFSEVIVIGHLQNDHDNCDPYATSLHVYSTLSNHQDLNLDGRNVLLSCTAGLPWSEKGCKANHRKTICDLYVDEGRAVMVTQYSLTPEEFKRERKKLNQEKYY